MEKYTYQDWLDALERNGIHEMYQKGTPEEATEIGAAIFMRQIELSPEHAIPIICNTLAALITERARREPVKQLSPPASK